MPGARKNINEERGNYKNSNKSTKKKPFAPVYITKGKHNACYNYNNLNDRIYAAGSYIYYGYLYNIILTYQRINNNIIQY